MIYNRGPKDLLWILGGFGGLERVLRAKAVWDLEVQRFRDTENCWPEGFSAFRSLGVTVEPRQNTAANRMFHAGFSSLTSVMRTKSTCFSSAHD